MNSRVEKFFNAENIFHSFYPFHVLSKFSGLSLYKFDPQSGDVKVSVFNLILFALIFVGLAVVSFLYLTDVLMPSLDPNYQARLIDLYKDYSGFLVNIVVYELGFLIFYAYFLIIFDFMRRKKLQEFLQSLKDFDDTLNKSETPRKIRNSYFSYLFIFPIPILQFIFFQFYYCTQEIFYFNSWMLSSVLLALVVCFNMTFVVPSVRFSFSVVLVRARLEVMNEKLR